MWQQQQQQQQKKRKTIEYVFYLDSLNVQATHRCTLLRIQGATSNFLSKSLWGGGQCFVGKTLTGFTTLGFNAFLIFINIFSKNCLGVCVCVCTKSSLPYPLKPLPVTMKQMLNKKAM